MRDRLTRDDLAHLRNIFVARERAVEVSEHILHGIGTWTAEEQEAWEHAEDQARQIESRLGDEMVKRAAALLALAAKGLEAGR